MSSNSNSNTEAPLRHVELGGRIVPFAGWEMPVQYTGIIEEHMAVRNTAGLFDVSHMGEARVRGRQLAVAVAVIYGQPLKVAAVGGKDHFAGADLAVAVVQPPGVDLKQGEGGLVDLEFLLQTGVLDSAGAHPQVLEPRDTPRLIDALASIAWLPGGTRQGLHDAHAALLDVGLACTLDRRPRLAAPTPVVLVAHSLGCILTAAWAQHSQNTHRVKAAFLVGPGDPEREELQAPLKSWWPVVMDKLPFPAELLGSRNDPYCTFERAQQFATAWGADFVDCRNAGHLNADSGLGDWPEGIARLHALIARAG